MYVVCSILMYILLYLHTVHTSNKLILSLCVAVLHTGESAIMAIMSCSQIAIDSITHQLQINSTSSSNVAMILPNVIVLMPD